VKIPSALLVNPVVADEVMVASPKLAEAEGAPSVEEVDEVCCCSL
jgi:hypothetical protein